MNNAPRPHFVTGRAGGIPRRALLRGLGVSMALPYLEAMTGLTATGSVARAAGALLAEPAKAPLRVAFIFTPNGVHYPAWLPTGEGPNYTLSPTLEPLAPVRRHLNILTGLTLDKARANGDGPGDHARSSATFLTGCQARKTSGNDINVGISVDQFAARQVGHLTRLPSLEIGCEHTRPAGNCDSGYSCAYTSNISWADEDTPVPKMVDPAAVFERLFGDAAGASARRDRIRRRASILDYVRDDADTLGKRLGKADQRKLDEFQTSVREIERRVQIAMDQSADEPLPDRPAPAGIPRKLGDHIDLMYDMMLLAFQTDTTRIATCMLGTGGSNRSMPDIDIREGHHELSHHQNNQDMIDKIRRIDRFYAERFAAFLQRLADTPEGHGSLLDNCLILHGSGISDGNTHNHENLPILLAGRAGNTIDTGSHIALEPETPMCNLYMSILQRMGCDVATFGDATGPLPGLT
ncbi:MAG: DUF1552 domain-containing protein [Phycisphaerales bacterium]|nr:DUF1552 domain-containing protein [Phycisphaerales bacterium]